MTEKQKKPTRGVVDPRTKEIHHLPPQESLLSDPKSRDGTWKVEYLPDSRDMVARITLEDGSAAFEYRDQPKRFRPEEKKKQKHETDVTRGLETPPKSPAPRGRRRPVIPEKEREKQRAKLDAESEELNQRTEKKAKEIGTRQLLGFEGSSFEDDPDVKEIVEKRKKLVDKKISLLDPGSSEKDVGSTVDELAKIQELTGKDDDFTQQKLDEIDAIKQNKDVGDGQVYKPIDPYDFSGEDISEYIPKSYRRIPDPFVRPPKKKLNARGTNDTGT